MPEQFPLMVPGATPDDEHLDVRAPYDGSLIATVERGGPPVVERALDTAYRLFRDRDAWLSAAFADAEESGISGKDTTPFLLSHIASHSGGRTVAANIALIESNARLAARIAVALSELEKAPTHGDR